MTGTTVPGHLKNSICILYKSLDFHGLHYPGFIINGPPVGRINTLEKAVVSLGIEETFFIKARFLEAVVHVGGDHEIILVFYQFVQILIDRFRRIHVAVNIDISRPECPPGLYVRIGVKSARVHILNTETLRKIRKVSVETLPIIDKTGGSGKPRTRADHDSIRCIDLCFQFLYGFLPGKISFGKAAPEALYTGDAAFDGFPVSVRLFKVIPVHSISYPLP